MFYKSFCAVLISLSLYANNENGEKIYYIYCSNCHSINMNGGMGKDFNLVSYSRTNLEIFNYVSNPGINFRKYGYSANAMPTLPLSSNQIQDVAEYISSLQPFKKWMKK